MCNHVYFGKEAKTKNNNYIKRIFSVCISKKKFFHCFFSVISVGEFLFRESSRNTYTFSSNILHFLVCEFLFQEKLLIFYKSILHVSCMWGHFRGRDSAHCSPPEPPLEKMSFFLKFLIRNKKKHL